ncbi:MAG: glycosyltransferase 87 family protein [Solirubrobacteraceae bacterium]
MLGLALALVPIANAQTAGSTAGQGPDSVLELVGPVLAVPGRALHPRRVLAIARATPEVAGQGGGLAERLYLRSPDAWQVSFIRAGDEVAQVVIGDDARVREAWSGIQVDWTMARGYEGAFGRQAASLPVWLVGLLLFLAPFARRPWRMLHVDLLVLASFSISLAFFSRGAVEVSVPLAYPPLLYLLARLLHLARRGGRPPEPLRLVGARWLAAGIVFLIGFRLALQGFHSNVIDVGYSGVIGADRITGGQDLYGSFPSDNPHGDTYGPLVYLAYVPFELLSPWTGTWDDLPAAHAASAVFDLACAAGLYLVGRRSSPTRGLLLAYLWLAFPFTLLAANSGANDALTGLLVLAAVALPAGRGALGMAAALTKLAPAVLLPLLVRTRRDALTAAAVLAAALAFVAVLDGGLGDAFERTVLFQVDRDSPFSVWGLYDLRGQFLAQLAVAGLALLAARREGDRYALAAALLVAVQLTAGHWFYLYLDWLLPVAFVALLAPYAIGRSTGSMEDADRGFPAQRTSTALSHGSSVAAP